MDKWEEELRAASKGVRSPGRSGRGVGRSSSSSSMGDVGHRVSVEGRELKLNLRVSLEGSGVTSSSH